MTAEPATASNESNMSDQFEKLPRLTAGELKERFAKKESEKGTVRLSLADILFGDEKIHNADSGATVIVRPVNFKGLGLFEREYGDLSKIPDEVVLRSSIRELTRVLLILVNQDLPTKDEKTADDVGQVINAENIDAVVKVCMSAIRPTHASASGLAEAAQIGHA